MSLLQGVAALMYPGIDGRRASRARDTGHFSKPIIREILSLALFNRLQNETCHEFRGIALGIIGRRSASGWTPHPVFAKVRRRDERINFADDDVVLFQFGARRETESKKRSLRR